MTLIRDFAQNIKSDGDLVISGDIKGSVLDSTGYIRILDSGTQAGGIYKEKTISGAGTSNDISIFAESITDGGSIHFMTGGSATKRLTIDTSGDATFGGKIEVGVFNQSQTNSGEAWIGRAADRDDGCLTIQLGGDSATGTVFEIVDRTWSRQIISISGEAPASSFVINSSGNTTFAGTLSNTGAHTITNGALKLSQAYNVEWGSGYNSGDPALWGNTVDKALRFAPDGTTTGMIVEINTSGITTTKDVTVETDVRLDVPYRSSKRISNIAAAATQAKRYHIGRLYYTSAHWSAEWTTIRIKCRQIEYTNGELEYVIRNGYTGGNGVPHNIYLVSNIGYTQDFNLFLDNPVDAGWDHTSSGDVYYQDVYADVDYYQKWTLDITSSTSYIYNTNASGFGDNWRVVFYDSPTSSNIASFTQGHGIDHPSYHTTISFGDGSGINFGLMTGGGAFSAGTGTSSTLDDYEEGTWTPTLQGFTGSYAVRDAAYTKIGNTVFAEFHIDVNVPGGSGDLVITGLPFTKENISNHYGGVTSLHCNGWSTTTKPDGGIIPFNTTLINFYTSLGQTSATKPNLTDLGSGNFLGVAVYRA